MSGLKSAWEISLEKSDKMLPAENRKKLTAKQKQKISGIRQEYQAKIADRDVTLQHKLKRLGDRTRPEEMAAAVEQLRQEFASEKEALEKEMERAIDAVRESAE